MELDQQLPERPAGSGQAVARSHGTSASPLHRHQALPTTGPGRIPAHRDFLALRVPIRVAPRHTYVSGDLALLIVDWFVEGRAAHGGQVRIAGTATDVARRGPDGFWRYVIDSPFGTAADGAEQTGRPTEVGPTDAAAGPTSPDGTGQSAIGR
ncbi:YybH family protein [Streptomyces parvus]|uniref:YybH family protein n=1 Tax=Streptomyces parvus TaxID=66428 RepID=UPI0037A62071